MRRWFEPLPPPDGAPEGQGPAAQDGARCTLAAAWHAAFGPESAPRFCAEDDMCPTAAMRLRRALKRAQRAHAKLRPALEPTAAAAETAAAVGAAGVAARELLLPLAATGRPCPLGCDRVSCLMLTASAARLDERGAAEVTRVLGRVRGALAEAAPMSLAWVRAVAEGTPLPPDRSRPQAEAMLSAAALHRHALAAAVGAGLVRGGGGGECGAGMHAFEASAVQLGETLGGCRRCGRLGVL